MTDTVMTIDHIDESRKKMFGHFKKESVEVEDSSLPLKSVCADLGIDWVHGVGRAQ